MSASVALTFDDLFVDNWLAARDLFDEFDARVTFCISGLHGATDDEIEGLYVLQADGHEIAYHTRTHPRLIPYIENFGIEQWVREELDRGIKEHHAFGFPAKSFACPFHRSTPKSRAASAERFAVTRAFGPRSAKRRNLRKRVYHQPSEEKTVDCIGFCDFSSPIYKGWDWQMGLLDLIEEEDGTGVFAGHDIRAEMGDSRFFSTPDQIRDFLKAVTDRGLAFKTLSEIAS